MKDARSRWILTLLVLIVVGRLVLAQTTARETPLYAPMTFPIDIESSLYTNPFDADDIELVGVFESPSGRQLIIPGFWMQPYSDECQEPCRVRSLQTDGDPTWQCALLLMRRIWAYNLQVRDDGTSALKTASSTLCRRIAPASSARGEGISDISSTAGSRISQLGTTCSGRGARAAGWSPTTSGCAS
ncbi:MAG: hypothetical protein U0703_21790 [Anaerolineae bacterium]